MLYQGGPGMLRCHGHEAAFAYEMDCSLFDADRSFLSMPLMYANFPKEIPMRS